MTTGKLSLRHEEQAFARLLEDFVAWAATGELACRPYAGTGPVRFAALPSERRREVAARFALFFEVCQSGGLAACDRVLFWDMVRRLGLTPRSDFLAHVELGDRLQILGRDLTLVFCSPVFLAGTSHALDELFCRPFYELFRRDPRKTQLLLSAALAALDGRSHGTARVGGGIHPVEETGTERPFRSLVELKVLAPLVDAHGSVVALASTLHCYAQDRVALAVNDG